MDFKEQLSKEVDQAVKKFRKQTEKIEESPDPRLAGRDVKDFEIGKLKAELEQQVGEINERYREKAEAHLEQAKRDAALSYFKPSVSDKDYVGSILDDFTSSVAFAYSDAEKEAAFSELESRFEHMTPEQLYAVKTQLPKVLQSVQGDELTMKKLKGVNNTLSELRTPQQEILEDAKQLALSSPDMTFRRLKMTHRAFNKQKPIGGIE